MLTKKIVYMLSSLLCLLIFFETGHANVQKKIVIASKNKSNAWLGVELGELDREIRSKLNVSVRDGVVINHILSNSPADKAGFEPGDIIIRFNGDDIAEIDELIKNLADHDPGDIVDVQVVRGQQELTLTVKLGEKSDAGFDDEEIKILLNRSSPLGIEVISLNADLAGYFLVAKDDGILVTKVEQNSTADKAGLVAGDVICEIDKEPIRRKSDLRILKEYDEGDRIDLCYYRKGKLKKTTVEISDVTKNNSFLSSIHLPDPDMDFDIELKLDDLKSNLERHRERLHEYKFLLDDHLKQELEKMELENEKRSELLDSRLKKLEKKIEMLQDEIKDLKK
jgi:predicted metalloprotease with PDZ domain